MTPLHPQVRRAGRCESRQSEKLDGRRTARHGAEGTPMIPINAYMNYAFCALALVALAGIGVAIMVSH